MKKKFSSVPDPDMQDAVIYARYSSHSQRDCSIEQQVADCELFAQQNGLRVVKIYADRHLSGTTDNRPQFQQMLKDAAHGHWPFVICWKIVKGRGYLVLLFSDSIGYSRLYFCC